MPTCWSSICIGDLSAASISTSPRARPGWRASACTASTPPTPWPTTMVLSGFCSAITLSSMSAAVSSANGSGSGLVPWPGSSTMTTL